MDVGGRLLNRVTGQVRDSSGERVRGAQSKVTVTKSGGGSFSVYSDEGLATAVGTGASVDVVTPNGKFDFYLDAGTYTLTYAGSGRMQDPDTVTVADTVGSGPGQSGTTVAVTPTPPASVSSLLGWFSARFPNGFSDPLPVASDQFTRADSASVPGTSTAGSKAWTSKKGTNGISSNKLYSSALTSSEAIVTMDAAITDVYAEVDLTWATSAEAGIVLCYVDDNNYVRCRVGGTYFRIQKKIAGVVTSYQAASAPTLANGDTVRIRVRIRGAVVEMVVTTAAGASYRVYTTLIAGDLTALASSTLHGVFSDSTTVRFDNWLVSVPKIADGLGVDTWVDLAGVANTTVITNPAQMEIWRDNSGDPYIEPVSGASIPLAIASTPVGTMSCFAVAQSSGAGLERVAYMGAGDAALNVYANRLFGSGGSYEATGFAFPSSGYGVYGMSGSSAGFTGLGPGVHLYANGESKFRTQDSGTSAWPATAVTAVNLMARGLGQATERFTGNLKSFVLYGKAVTKAEAAGIVAYLAKQWAITLVTPTENVVFDGDSQTVGFIGSTVGHGFTDAVINTYTPYVDAYNFGKTGWKVPDLAADMGSQVQALYDPAKSKNKVLLWVGTNDLAAVPGDYLTPYNQLVALAKSHRAAGFKVIVATALPRGAAAQYETDRVAYNALIRANYATFADALCDIGADATIGAASAQDNATYYQGTPGGTHLTAAGYAIAAALAATALAAV